MRRRFRRPEVIRAWAIVIETDPYVNDNANPADLNQELSKAVVGSISHQTSSFTK
jgi:hypothetical protein